jgi:lipopolysaccharide/colanic/teichoic acid biosynthesis glycosyltransferase
VFIVDRITFACGLIQTLALPLVGLKRTLGFRVGTFFRLRASVLISKRMIEVLLTLLTVLVYVLQFLVMVVMIVESVVKSLFEAIVHGLTQAMFFVVEKREAFAAKKQN